MNASEVFVAISIVGAFAVIISFMWMLHKG